MYNQEVGANLVDNLQKLGLPILRDCVSEGGTISEVLQLPYAGFLIAIFPAVITPPSLMQFTAEERKNMPVYSGVLKYFPLALLEIAKLSQQGNEQHNPGKPLHWDRSKSGDELDALSRHLLEAGTFDTDGMRHSAKLAWRALANLQKEIENDRKTRTGNI